MAKLTRSKKQLLTEEEAETKLDYGRALEQLRASKVSKDGSTKLTGDLDFAGHALENVTTINNIPVKDIVTKPIKLPEPKPVEHPPRYLVLATNEVIQRDKKEILVGGGVIAATSESKFSWEVLGFYVEGLGGGNKKCEVRLYDFTDDPDSAPVSVLEIVGTSLTVVRDELKLPTGERHLMVYAYLDAEGLVDATSLVSVKLVEK